MSDVNPDAVDTGPVVTEQGDQVEKLPDHYDGVKWPGKIAFSGEIRGHYAGCKLVEFSSAEEVNTFFESTPHVVCVQVFSAGERICVLYTTALTADELDDIAAWGRDQRAFMVERQQLREQGKRDAEKAKRLEEAETKRLAALGKTHEANCGTRKFLKKGK